MNKKTKISIDYHKCGDGVGVDPRDTNFCYQIFNFSITALVIFSMISL
jgi:hypothetical protein